MYGFKELILKNQWELGWKLHRKIVEFIWRNKVKIDNEESIKNTNEKIENNVHIIYLFTFGTGD